MILPADAAAIAWDIDGTLVDSEPLHNRALLDGSSRFGVDLSDLPDMAFRGVHMPEVWRILRPRLPASLDRDSWLSAIEDAYVAGVASLRPMPGAALAVARLAAAGLVQVCVSNSARRIVDANLRVLGLERTIAFSISLNDVTKGKPDPEPYARAAARLGLPPGRIWAVEDSATGLASAKAAGLRRLALRPDPAAAALTEAQVSHLDEIGVRC